MYCYEINNQSITLIWSSNLSCSIYAKSVIHDEFNIIIVITTEGELNILAKSTGEILTRFKLPGEVFSSPLLLDNHVYVGCRDNYLYKIKIIN